jgi:predicted amidophosphoribosyltransferase
MKCPGCEAEVDADQDFCMECGEPIGTAAVVDVPSKGPPAKPPAAPAPTPAPPRAAPTPGLNGVPKPSSLRTTLPATGRAKRREPEPEPVRCPGCGTKTLAQRCPGCGTKLRQDDE